jgi:polysaccharide pyruvyl transferase WcaK-like protein
MGVKQIVVLDTWVGDDNLGNKIIVDAVHREVRSIFPDSIIYSLPNHEYIRAGRGLVRRADHVFLAGTNPLSADMNRTSEWRVRLSDGAWLNDVVLVGVGWWKYQSKAFNPYTKRLLPRILSSKFTHSVRSMYEVRRLRSLGIGAIPTGCPSMWELTPDHCEKIPVEKGSAAVVTLTDYRRIPEQDRLLLDIVIRNYDVVYYWPQSMRDYDYVKELGSGYLEILTPSLEAYDHLLLTGQVDYIGTRLHAGIRALQHQRRSLIVSVDNRAREMGRQFALPLIPRECVASLLESKLRGQWKTDIGLDVDALSTWRSQFNTTGPE